jgi:hypothetical protein
MLNICDSGEISEFTVFKLLMSPDLIHLGDRFPPEDRLTIERCDPKSWGRESSQIEKV